jgi:glycosyltransferase involved in cell wall biosynthesis
VTAAADFLICNSQATSAIFPEGIPKATISNCIDLERFDLINTIDPQRIVIGMISSNLPKKGIFDFVEVAKLVRPQAPQAVFRLIGPENEHTGRIAAEHPGLIEMAGYCDDALHAIGQCNIILNLSHFQESFGRTVLEGMAARRPLVVYDWGALNELVKNGVNGYLVPFKDVAAVARRVGQLVAEPALIAGMGKAGRTLSEDFGKPLYAERLQTAYRTILGAVPTAGTAPAPVSTPAPRTDAPPMHEGKPRIAYFLWHFPVPSETFVLSELKELIATGHDVQVFCKESPYPEFVPDFRISWQRVTSPEQLALRLRESGRSVIHAHFTYPTVTNFVWPACEIARIPFTFIAHAQDIFKTQNIEKNRIAEIVASELCLRVVTLGRFHRRFLEDQGVAAHKILINPNAVDVSQHPFADPLPRFGRPIRKVCALQRFVEKKGIRDLILAASDPRMRGIQFDLYGYGPLEGEYRALIASLGLTNVTLQGAIKTKDELIAMFAEHDLLISPCVVSADGDMDGIPTVLVEGMLCGIPVISTQISSVPDLIRDGIDGQHCTPGEPTTITEAIIAYAALHPMRREAMLLSARRKAEENHCSKRLMKRLSEIWTGRTVDIVIVSWNNLPELKEVISRIRTYTGMDYRLFIVDNNSQEPIKDYLREAGALHDNLRIILQPANTFVGPATNTAMDAGSSDFAVYVCAKEGMALRANWEAPLIEYMERNPEVGLAGTLCHSPEYLNGAGYAKSLPLFAKFRNQQFAVAHPERVFRHVQGGLFILRRAMYREIGGFSEAVPHNHTDTEYSYYAESRGWRLGQVPKMLALFIKSRPGILSRIDEDVRIMHPGSLELNPLLDSIAQEKTRLCNLCEWHGSTFAGSAGDETCPQCGSRPLDRTVWRFLAESTFLYRRLVALWINPHPALLPHWKRQFQGKTLEVAELLAAIRSAGKFDARSGGTSIINLQNAVGALNPADLALLLRECARLLTPQGIIMVSEDITPTGATGTASRAGLVQEFAAQGFALEREVRYASSVVRYDWQPLFIFVRAASQPQ